MSAISSSKHHTETEKVETVADMSDAGLFFRESHSAVAVKHLSNLITQSLGIAFGAPRDEYAPVVSVTCETNIGLSFARDAIRCLPVMTLIVQEPVQLVQDHIGQKESLWL